MLVSLATLRASQSAFLIIARRGTTIIVAVVICPDIIYSSYVPETNGRAAGLVPMLRTFEAASRYVDQGAGKRPGTFNMFLEPWHADVFDFLDIRKNSGKEELRARHLFCALWIPDLL